MKYLRRSFFFTATAFVKTLNLMPSCVTSFVMMLASSSTNVDPIHQNGFTSSLSDQSARFSF